MINYNSLIPIEKFSIRNMLLWAFLSIFGWFILSIALNVYNNSNSRVATPLFFIFWFYGWTALWFLFRIKRSGNLKKMIGSFPAKNEFKDVVVMGIMLFVFSVSSFVLIFYTLSNFSPGLLRFFISNSDKMVSLKLDFSTLYSFEENMQRISIGIFFAPFIEEFIFRGLLFQNLLKRWNSLKWVLITTSFLFALLHTDFVGKFLFGIVVGILYLKTGKLLAAMICHSVNNAMSLSLIALEYIATPSQLLQAINQYIWIDILLIVITLIVLLRFVYKNWPNGSKL